MRALILARGRSPSTAVEVSSDAQRSVGEAFAAVHGWEVVGYVDEIEAASPDHPLMERGALKPWLTEPDRLALWDVLVVEGIERLSRLTSEVDAFVAWADANGKRLAVAASS